MPFSYQNMQFWASLSIPRVQLTSNSDSMAKCTIEKCVRANIFDAFLPGIVKKRSEMVVLRSSVICKKLMLNFFHIWQFEYPLPPDSTMDKHAASRQDFKFVIGDIFVVN